jgi:hypothetical protein
MNNHFMRLRSSAGYVFALCAVCLLTACDFQIGRIFKGPPTARILFIGNSYIEVNGGIDKQLEGLAPSIETSRIDAAGYTLERHWTDGKAIQAIRQGGWNYVVLQEQSQTPIFNQKQFNNYVRSFDMEIKSIGAKTILLMTWERPDSVRYGVTTANLANAYNSIGRATSARVAPAGLAFARSLRDKPNLTLYNQDGHPNTYGTYLAACVLYMTIFVASPVGNPYSDWSISPELRAYFQQIAAETPAY